MRRRELTFLLEEETAPPLGHCLTPHNAHNTVLLHSYWKSFFSPALRTCDPSRPFLCRLPAAPSLRSSGACVNPIVAGVAVFVEERASKRGRRREGVGGDIHVSIEGVGCVTCTCQS